MSSLGLYYQTHYLSVLYRILAVLSTWQVNQRSSEFGRLVRHRCRRREHLCTLTPLVLRGASSPFYGGKFKSYITRTRRSSGTPDPDASPSLSVRTLPTTLLDQLARLDSDWWYSDWWYLVWFLFIVVSTTFWHLCIASVIYVYTCKHNKRPTFVWSSI